MIGDLSDDDRGHDMGIVVEHADAKGKPAIGPIAHTGYFRDEFVVRCRWLDGILSYAVHRAHRLFGMMDDTSCHVFRFRRTRARVW